MPTHDHMQMSLTAEKGKAVGRLSLPAVMRGRDPDPTAPGYCVDCALGPAGLVGDKREGDGGTPLGRMALVKVFYRPDRVAPPLTGLPSMPLTPAMGWCDDPTSPAYNRLVYLPFDGSHEKMWREDHAYDLCVVLDWNLSPAVPGRGSAIFFHLAREGYAPTEGCIAVNLEDMKRILMDCGEGSAISTTLAD